MVDKQAVPKDVSVLDNTSIDDHHAEAQLAAEREHSLTFTEAIRTYPTAVAWSLFFSLGVIMAVRVISKMYFHTLTHLGIRPTAHRKSVRNTSIPEGFRISLRW